MSHRSKSRGHPRNILNQCRGYHPSAERTALADRETVARIINPELFVEYDLLVKQGTLAENGKLWSEVVFGKRIEALHQKADAIIAALRAAPAAEGAVREALTPFAGLATLFDNFEVDRREPEKDSVLVSVKLVDLRAARAALAFSPPERVPAAEPVAYAIYGINRYGKRTIASVKFIIDEWKFDDDGLSNYWSGNEPLYAAPPATPAQSGAHREATLRKAAATAERVCREYASPKAGYAAAQAIRLLARPR